MDASHGRFSPKNLVCMANTHEEVKAARDLGMIYSDLINHNCWLDYNLYKCQNRPTRTYDLVCNARPEKWKRVHLAKDIEKLAIIQGNLNRKHQYVDYKLMNPAYLNDKRIPPAEVVSIINQSEAGGIFSQVEGACYSSSEYLLCGIPVISTPSKGGRDIFYNSDNSIIVNPDSRDVVAAVTSLISRRKNAHYSPHDIRNQHIEISNSMRRTFKHIIARIFALHYKGILSDSYFDEFFVNKLIRKQPFIPGL